MVELNKLSPPALKAAMKDGTSSYGTWGSATEHTLYVEALPPEYVNRHWRMCRCGCRKRARYAAKGNGVALASGCEFSMRRWVGEMNRHKGQR